MGSNIGGVFLDFDLLVTLKFDVEPVHVVMKDWEAPSIENDVMATEQEREQIVLLFYEIDSE